MEEGAERGRVKVEGRAGEYEGKVDDRGKGYKDGGRKGGGKGSHGRLWT